MEVTSRELREGNIRDALRGYNHDDVDELLERAAATVDTLSARVRELTDQLQAVESQASRGRETEEQLSRALLVAQRTADEVVDDARQSAQRILDEAERDAARLVTEAERAAKAEVEEETRRLEAEVLRLGAAREALETDVNALTAFADELGRRLREALESQIAALEDRRIDLSGRPRLHDVELPVPEERVARPVEVPGPTPTEEPLTAHGGAETAQIEAVGEFEEPAADYDESLGRVEEPEPRPSEPEPEQQRSEPETEPSRHSALLDERFGLGPARPLESRGKAFEAGEVLEGEVLDDDTFFASLRDAVRDDSPLGPRDEEQLGPPETHGDLFDQDEVPEGRGLFRRKR